jgi:glycosyltransferase involved in cell wall biosynthesis
VVASKSSEASLRRLGLVAKYLPYPWPAGSPSTESQQLPRTKPSFAFFGSLSGLGSRSAFHTLLSDVYPELVKTWGSNGFQVLLAGSREMPDWVRGELDRKPEILFQGFVDDLAALLGRCHATLVPIAVPVGNRSRIVTAMAHGGLVIAHRNTAMGNPHLVSGENCLLAARPSEFVTHMRFAVDTPQKTDAIRRNARETYERHFAPSKAVQRLLNEIICLLRLGQPRRA